MPERLTPGSWKRPDLTELHGTHVTVSRLDPERDIDDLYAVSHGSDECERLWTYMWYGPFADKRAMREWLDAVKAGSDPLYFSVYCHARQRRVGMYSLLNIVPEMGRAELGNIWYSPLVQKTNVNTETTFLFLCYLFDHLGYRRVEWKCDNRNSESKRAALRMGFRPEGVFRKHMIVKGQNRDTAWFAIVDDDWPAIKANFEAYLTTPGLSLTRLNASLTAGSDEV